MTGSTSDSKQTQPLATGRTLSGQRHPFTGEAASVAPTDQAMPAWHSSSSSARTRYLPSPGRHGTGPGHGCVPQADDLMDRPPRSVSDRVVDRDM